MTTCLDHNIITGCYSGTPVLIHVRDDGAGKPALRIVDLNGDIVAGADGTNTVPGPCQAVPTPVTFSVTRETSATTQAAGSYRSASVTALSGDVVINGAAVPAGFSWSVGGENGAVVDTALTVDGSDYVLTVVA